MIFPNVLHITIHINDVIVLQFEMCIFEHAIFLYHRHKRINMTFTHKSDYNIRGLVCVPHSEFCFNLRIKKLNKEYINTNVRLEHLCKNRVINDWNSLSSYTECSTLDDNCKSVTLIDCMVNKKCLLSLLPW